MAAKSASASKQEKTSYEKKTFTCSLCSFEMDYHYHGSKPPFAKSLMLLEECYIMKDPFSTTGGLITVGAACSLCHALVCMASECSLFYTKRFCMPCVVKNVIDFPSEIQEEVMRRQQEETS